MNAKLIAIATVSCGLAACASYPTPVQRLADAESATRTAQELGANSNPRSQLHLRLAQEEVARAKSLVDDHDNQRAEFVLIRANADAELAVAETREAAAEGEAQKAMQQGSAMQQGATIPVSASTTTTTTNSSSGPSPAGASPASMTGTNTSSVGTSSGGMNSTSTSTTGTTTTRTSTTPGARP